MTDIRRTLLWVVFCTSLLLIWDGWNKHNGQASMFSPSPRAELNTASTAASGQILPSPVTTGLPSEKIVINTDLMMATFDSLGGSLVGAVLSKHEDVKNSGKKVVILDQSSERFYVAQTGLVLASGGEAQFPNYLSHMRFVAGETTLKENANELQVRFESEDQGPIKLIKTYTFKRGDYVIGVKHEVVNVSPAAVSPQLYFQLVRDGGALPGESSFYSTFTGPAMYTELAKFQKIDFKDIEKNKVNHEKSSDGGWVAMVQHYFSSAWLLGSDNQTRQNREFFAKKVDTNKYSIGMVVPLGELAPGARKIQEARLFIGPQEENQLSALAPGLDLVKDYGMFTILAKPLFWLLTQLHKFLGNWGWAIVSLVVVLKAAFFWLNAYAYRSMAKMKLVSPKIAEMSERLKDQPQKKQQETMRIYKEEGVNPIGGCLPIFVQMPFFIALYWVLLSSVEMRNAPWIGWITDLSATDPYFILPLLMTASSLLQTWLNPTPADPMQARMMWLMPLFFSVMFFFFPAGLVLYWLTNNVLSILQQYLINKRLGVLGK
jgi:YidC/Oxa1 family membrane protein insertase